MGAMWAKCRRFGEMKGARGKEVEKGALKEKERSNTKYMCVCVFKGNESILS